MNGAQAALYIAASVMAAGAWFAVGAAGRKAWDWATKHHQQQRRR